MVTQALLRHTLARKSCHLMSISTATSCIPSVVVCCQQPWGVKSGRGFFSSFCLVDFSDDSWSGVETLRLGKVSKLLSSWLIPQVPSKTDRMSGWILLFRPQRQTRPGRRRRPSAVDPRAPGFQSVPQNAPSSVPPLPGRKARDSFSVCTFPTRPCCFPSSWPQARLARQALGPSKQARSPQSPFPSPLTLTSPGRCG